MSGFSASWLALREPADRAARDMALVRRLAGHLANPLPGKGAEARLLDIGCGSGSTWRGLAPHLPPGTRWTLLDHDAALLAEAALRIDRPDTVAFHEQDLNDIDALPLDDVAVVTASALFDLCSASFCARLMRRLAALRCGLYAALTYDGRIGWTRPHPLDTRAVAGFNRHQTSEKGFGPALGPEAAAHLAGLARDDGYVLYEAASPWRMGVKDGELQDAFLDGFRRPLLDVAEMSAAEIDAWLDFRRSQVPLQGSLCVVGHADILALPL